MLIENVMLVGLVRINNFGFRIILFRLMMFNAAEKFFANFAFYHRGNLILSDAEISNIVDCKHRDRAFQSLLW